MAQVQLMMQLKQSTFFTCHHAEDDSPATLQYSTGNDLAQSTGFKI
jgi:hypothetical protein